MERREAPRAPCERPLGGASAPPARLRRSPVTRACRFEARAPNDVGGCASRRSTWPKARASALIRPSRFPASAAGRRGHIRPPSGPLRLAPPPVGGTRQNGDGGIVREVFGAGISLAGSESGIMLNCDHKSVHKSTPRYMITVVSHLDGGVMAKTRHVLPNPKGGWSVRQSGASRASRVFGTQADAMKFGRAIAKQEGAELYVHRRDGTIRQKDSYGSDPFPPKDTR